jgi:hypothetical protein
MLGIAKRFGIALCNQFVVTLQDTLWEATIDVRQQLRFRPRDAWSCALRMKRQDLGSEMTKFVLIQLLCRFHEHINGDISLDIDGRHISTPQHDDVASVPRALSSIRILLPGCHKTNS